MKKILVVLSCVALVLPLLALSAFAVNSVQGVFSVDFSTPYLIRVSVDGVTIGDASDPFSVSLPVGRVVSVGARAVAEGYPGDLFSVLYNGERLSTDPSNPTVIPYSSAISFSCVSRGGALNYYIFIENPSPLDELNVSSGVESSVSFTGQVLSFLTSNSNTIVLIGLSVAMFAILPFGISKIKQLIKGY